MSRSRLRSVLAQGALLGVSLVGALVLAEVALRLTGLGAVATVHSVDARQFDRVPGLMAPGQSVQVDRRPSMVAARLTEAPLQEPPFRDRCGSDRADR